MYFTDIMAIVSAVFSSYFLLFVTFGPTSPASLYTVSGHSHTLDMAIHEHSIRDPPCSMRIGRDVTSIVAALHASWPVDVQCWVCVLCSLVPSPTPSFPSLLSTVKRGGPGTFPHVSDVKGRKG